MGTTLVQGQVTEEKEVKVETVATQPPDRQTDATQPADRENLIATAVRFLENSKIRSTSVELKTSFLKKKGLTDEEIATAFKQVKTLEESQTQVIPADFTGGPPASMPPMMPPFLPPPIPQYTVSKKIRDVLNVLLLIGGFSYGINYLWKKYIKPWWYGIERHSSEQMLLQTSQTLLTTVLTLKEGMEKLQASLDSMNGQGTRSENEVTDLKKEVMSLKGLLLSRRLRPRQASSSSLIPRGSVVVQSEPSTPFLVGGLASVSQSEPGTPPPYLAGLISPGGERQQRLQFSPEPELYIPGTGGSNSPEKALNLIEDIDD
eukprot:TRINITY_DN22886_c1_g2_i1.p1 TRINITY_DN22886_c1_g2~~TRINITY_DN22886_c1_g2_i1.p1  ORF type:complete len:318 (-),score=106.67 TRINITY_DN22886_c1_g2_i1:126-1079(-)